MPSAAVEASGFRGCVVTVPPLRGSRNFPTRAGACAPGSIQRRRFAAHSFAARLEPCPSIGSLDIPLAARIIKRGALVNRSLRG